MVLRAYVTCVSRLWTLLCCFQTFIICIGSILIKTVRIWACNLPEVSQFLVPLLIPCRLCCCLNYCISRCSQKWNKRDYDQSRMGDKCTIHVLSWLSWRKLKYEMRHAQMFWLHLYWVISNLWCARTCVSRCVEGVSCSMHYVRTVDCVHTCLYCTIDTGIKFGNVKYKL